LSIDVGIIVAAMVVSLEITAAASTLLAILAVGADGAGSVDCLFCGKWNASFISTSVLVGGIALASRAEVAALLAAAEDGGIGRACFACFGAFFSGNGAALELVSMC
jgi:hypothetical protein